MLDQDAPAFSESGAESAPIQVEEDRRPLPSTFQLAHLAAVLATQPESVKIPPAEVALEALQLWDAAQAVLAERERELAEGQ